MILVLGGTTEGRQLASYLNDCGFKVILSTATAFPAFVPAEGMRVLSGALDREGLLNIIDDQGIRALVDATHPFAREITGLAKSVCEDLELPYLRFERAAESIPDDHNIIMVDRLEDAPGAAADTEGNIFLATGVKSIGRFAAEISPARLFARIIPWKSSLDEALKWLAPANVIAAVGPFSREFNQACFRFFNAATLVTKDSGAGAGIEAKISAALDLKMNVIMVKRPPVIDGAFADFAGVAARLGDGRHV